MTEAPSVTPTLVTVPCRKTRWVNVCVGRTVPEPVTTWLTSARATVVYLY